MALQEMRWIGDGIIEKKNHSVFYSCDKKKHILGTGFVLGKRCRHLVMDFEAKSPRLCKLRIRGSFFNYSLINAHAPTEDKDEDEKELFYDDLHMLYTSCPRNDIKVILGDFNAKIGKEDEYRPTIGRHSLHDITNDNGQRLILFAVEHGMVISSTFFQHKRIHKMTWRSPDGETFNQIDHIMIDSRHMTDIQDIRTYRGANFDSDHYMVISKIKARISNARKHRGQRIEKFDCEQLKDRSVGLVFQAQLAKNLEERAIQGIADVDEKWGALKEALLDTGNAVMGKTKKVQKKDWFDVDCHAITQKKNDAYRKMLCKRHSRSSVEEYKVARREEKKVHRTKKRIFHEDLFRDVEHLRGSNESRAFFREINLGRRDFKPRTNLCRNKEGVILSDKTEILRRWNEHFSDLLNAECLQTEELGTSDVNQDNVTLPSLTEVEEAIKKLKNNKAPGPDLIPPELIKNSGTDGAKILHNIILSVWDNETLPEDWRLSTVCLIHKKGDILECSNYRGISLLCTAYKIFSNILFERLSPFVENIIGDYQCGFRKGRSTTDQIFNIRQILEKTKEFGIGTHHLFVDFRTAYDSINRKRLIEAMREFDIPDKLVRLTALTLNKTMQRVKIQGDFSETMEIRNGVRQGDALACLLFNLALEKVIRDSSINTRGNIFYKSVQIFAFADDIDIIARTPNDLKQAFLALEREAGKMHLTINQEKTKYMQCARTADSAAYLEIGTYRFEKVDSFVYLGSEVNINNNISSEIQRRISAANRCFYGVKKYLKSNLIKRNTKLLIYKCLIRPILTYSSETWTMRQKDENALGIFERRILRAIFGGVKIDDVWHRRSNLDLYRAYKEPDIIKFIKIQRIKWAGHISRMEEGRCTRKIFLAKPTGNRSRGRPNLRWVDLLENDFKILKIKNWKSIANRREAWRKVLVKARAHPGLSCH